MLIPANGVLAFSFDLLMEESEDFVDFGLESAPRLPLLELF
jgi:hypothetical protein